MIGSVTTSPPGQSECWQGGSPDGNVEFCSPTCVPQVTETSTLLLPALPLAGRGREAVPWAFHNDRGWREGEKLSDPVICVGEIGPHIGYAKNAIRERTNPLALAFNSVNRST